MEGPVKRVKKAVRAWYYPRFRRGLFDDRRYARNVAAVRDMIAGRTVALVGNAQSLLVRTDGEEIDTCDVVVRINRGFIVQPESQGRRTDLYCLSTQSVKLKTIRAEFGGVPIIYCNRDRWVMTWDLWLRRRAIAFYPIAAWERLSATLDGNRPSTGMMALDLFRNHLGAAQVRLFGFDWKVTKTFYRMELSFASHDWERERALVARWAGEGGVTLPPG